MGLDLRYEIGGVYSVQASRAPVTRRMTNNIYLFANSLYLQTITKLQTASQFLNHSVRLLHMNFSIFTYRKGRNKLRTLGHLKILILGRYLPTDDLVGFPCN